MNTIYAIWLNCPGGGKIALFLGTWLLCWYPIAVLLGRKLGWQPWQAVTPPQKLPLVLSLYLLAPIPITLILGLGGQSLGDYGLRFTTQEFFELGIGLGFAVVGLAITFFFQIRTGLLIWHPDQSRQWLKGTPLFLLLAMAIALVEEVIFRGIFQSQLQAELSPWLAAVLGSAIFAVLHLLWERHLTLPQLPGLWLLGVVLVGARWLDGGNLALAWGLHAGWVFGLASVDATGVLTYPDQDGNLWVGKQNQPLAGIGGLLCLGITGGAIALVNWRW
jgi:membrane protease YdiL (CAAX protease family)